MFCFNAGFRVRSVGQSDSDGRRGSRDDGRAFRQHRTCHKRRDSQAIVPGLSTSSNGSQGDSYGGVKTADDQTMTPPTMVISSVTPPPTSPGPQSPTAHQQHVTAASSSSSATMVTATPPTQHSVSCGYTPPVSSPSSPVSATPPQLGSMNMAHAPPVSRRDSTTQVSVDV